MFWCSSKLLNEPDVTLRKHSTGHIIPISEHDVSIMKTIIVCFDKHYRPMSRSDEERGLPLYFRRVDGFIQAGARATN